MYFKVFQSMETSTHYFLRYSPDLNLINNGKFFIENEKKEAVQVNEGELYYLLDTFFKGKLNEKVKSDDQERRHEAR